MFDNDRYDNDYWNRIEQIQHEFIVRCSPNDNYKLCEYMKKING